MRLFHLVSRFFSHEQQKKFLKPNSGSLKSSTCSWLAFVLNRYYHAKCNHSHVVEILVWGQSLHSLCTSKQQLLTIGSSIQVYNLPMLINYRNFYQPCHCNLLRNKSFYKISLKTGCLNFSLTSVMRRSVT